MEGKERYELFGEHCIKDNNPDARCQLLNAYVACVILNEQDKENNQLKQQLHDLPKKIVGEIEKCFTEYLPLKDKTGAGFYSRLNAILKKHGGEDE